MRTCCPSLNLDDEVFAVELLKCIISVFISVIENCIFFMDVNSYVGKKVDLTYSCTSLWLSHILV